jgi:hypothetical protein
MNKLVTYKQGIDTTARVGSIYIYNPKHATCATCNACK